MWPVARAFWRLLGACTADLSYDGRVQRACSALLMATCVHNLYAGPEAVCKLDGWCDLFAPTTTTVMYHRAVAVTALLSRAAIVCVGERHVRRYARAARAFDDAHPAGAARRGRQQRAFGAAAVSACLAAVVPVNVARLCYLYRYERRFDGPLLAYYVFMYAQNLSMCCVETQFACQCYAVYARFREVNQGLGELRRRAAAAPHTCHRPRAAAEVAELLRVKHWMARQTADALNGLFGLQMGLSVFLLWIMALFDIYYELYKSDPFSVWIYCWLLQYALRLFLIIMVSHYTTKQALKSRSLITDTNNEILDNSTKEELQLFINQINSSPSEFNAYDFCTLNIQVIKSVMAAGATYLVILVQFHRSNLSK